MCCWCVLATPEPVPAAWTGQQEWGHREGVASVPWSAYVPGLKNILLPLCLIIHIPLFRTSKVWISMRIAVVTLVHRVQKLSGLQVVRGRSGQLASSQLASSRLASRRSVHLVFVLGGKRWSGSSRLAAAACSFCPFSESSESIAFPLSSSHLLFPPFGCLPKPGRASLNTRIPFCHAAAQFPFFTFFS